MLPITRRPSATAGGQRGEGRIQQHELRGRPRRGAPRAHRDADVGVLQGEHVVHAVAGHRDDVPAGLERLDHRALLLGGDPAEHGVRLERRPRAPSRSSGSVPRVDRRRRRPAGPLGARSPRRWRGSRREITLTVDALPAKYRACRPRPRAARSRRTTSADGHERPAGAVRRRAPSGAAEQDARAGRPRRSAARASRRRGAVVRREQHVGRAEHPRPGPSNVGPLHLRADENGTASRRRPPRPGRRGSARRSRASSRSARGRPRRARPARLRCRGRRRPRRAARRRRRPERPSVSVPVLSMHSTSTRASPSTAGSSWTSTRRRASRTTPTANATLVSSTRPSGTIATVPATAPRRASRTTSRSTGAG